ncbi:GGDEF domain-containing protein [Pseudodesulfovibrio sediminis]|nr:GGDEF domain-containing protein [Pseudodesulfovibrio sediminis]
MVKSDFQEVSRTRVFASFQEDVLGYIGLYGGLKEALASEEFDTYVRRNHRLQQDKRPPAKGTPPLVDRWEQPPFKLLLLDADGVVVMPAGGLKVGEKVSAAVMEEAVPIELKGEVVALGSTIGDEVFTPQDMRYLGAVKQSLIRGALIAIGLSLVLGVVFGRRLSKAVTDLTTAVKLMHEHREEVWQVEVTSNDELGELAESFNEMNVELARAHTELRELAIKDPLTGLYNRRHFDEQAMHYYESATRYEQPLSVMVGDLDHFKQINDTFSHEIGDLVLEKVAELFEKNTRKSDVVARYGGEEFVVLFAHTNKEHAAVSCENIRQAIEAYPWEEYHPDLKVTLSMGLCDATILGSVSSMISQADKLLYQAKSEGRNRLVKG